jgi:hypothetical protein|tara:strand:- start:841 stop:1188 length:348 start_codon:yes stop_codon:yes gene_type:complete
MKITKTRLVNIIQEELNYSSDLTEGDFPDNKMGENEIPIASIVYMTLGKALDVIHEYRGEMAETEEVSPDFELIHKKVADVWRMLDGHEDLGGGESPKEFYSTLKEAKKKGESDE